MPNSPNTVLLPGGMELPESLHYSRFFYVIATDTAGRIIYANPYFIENFSLPVGAETGAYIIYLAEEQEREKVRVTVEAALRQPGKPVGLSLLRHFTGYRGGSLVQWEITSFTDANGQQSGICCIGFDASAQVEAYQALQQANSQLEQLAGSFTDGFYVVSTDWVILAANHTLSELMRTPVAELEGKSFWDVFVPSPENIFPEKFRSVMETGKTVFFQEYIPKWHRYFDVLVYRVREGLAVFFRDITDVKEADKRLRYMMNKLRAILNSTGDSNILISPEYKILSFNRQTLENVRFLYKREIKEGDDVREFITPGTEELFLSDLQAAMKGTHIEREMPLYFSPGHSVWFRTRFFPAYDDQNRLIGVSFNSTNIDASKRAEIKLRRQNQQLLRIAEFHSHKVRGPLATLKGLSILLEKEKLTDNGRMLAEYMAQALEELDFVLKKLIVQSVETTHSEDGTVPEIL